MAVHPPNKDPKQNVVEALDDLLEVLGDEDKELISATEHVIKQQEDLTEVEVTSVQQPVVLNQKKIRAKRKAERQNVKHNRNKQKRKKNKRG